MENLQKEKSADLAARSKGSKRNVLIAASVVFIIAIIAAVAIFAFPNEESPASETSIEADNLFYQGLVAVCTDGKWGYADETGEIVIEPQFDYAGQFAKNGLATVSIEVDSGYKYGYIDKTGAYAIKPQFDTAYDFADNRLALVMSGEDLYGYIDEKGEYVIEPQFISAGDFDKEGLALVRMNTGIWGYIDEKGRFIFTPGNYEIHDQYGYGFADDGLVIVAVVDEKGYKYGYIDRTGEYAIEPQFEEANDFAENGLALVKSNGEYGYIDKTGSFVIEPQFAIAHDFTGNGLAVASKGNKAGFIDKTGEFVIEPVFDAAVSFNDGVACVVEGERCGVIDEQGSYIVKPKYIDIGPMSYAGIIFFSDDNGKIGCINTAGEEVISPQFDYIYQSDPSDEYAWREMGSYFYDDGYAVVRLNDKLGVINQDGDFMIEPQFDAIYDTALF